MTLGKAWFTRYLGTATTMIGRRSRWHQAPGAASWRTSARLPSTRRLSIALPGNDDLAGRAGAVRTSGRFTGNGRDLRLRDRAAHRAPDRGWVAPGLRPGSPSRARAPRFVSEGGINTTGLTGDRKLTIG